MRTLSASRQSTDERWRAAAERLFADALLARVTNRKYRAHTLMELVVAMVASGMLLAGLGSVMLIGRQVAYTPSAAVRRTEAADVISQITDELQYATLLIGQTPQVLEFVVADRQADGTAEKIRYEWSGTSGDPLYKTINGGTATVVLESVEQFDATYLFEPQITTLTTTTESAEAVLANTNEQAGTDRDITAANHSAHQINPAAFAGIPANAISWNATKVVFFSKKSGATNETLLVQLRATGESFDQPAGGALGQTNVPETSISASYGWNTAVFPDAIRDLALHRRYAIVWSQIGGGSAAMLRVNDAFTPNGVLESTDAGASWQFMTTRQMYSRVYGTYNTPGPSYNVTRNYISHVRIVLQSAEQSHGRIDASVPLINQPEHLSAYWRTDFDRDPTTTDINGDAVADWALAGGGAFDSATLLSGVWYATGALETRPLSDFIQPTVVDVRCRNTTVGGNGAVVRINADRQAGQYAPLFVHVRLLSDGTQSLSLFGKTSDTNTKQLFTRSRLSTDFVRFRLTIVPQNNIVNLTINDEDQGTFTYPTYAPSTNTDRYLTVFSDSSLAEFDYVDLRVAN